ncbi:conjugated polyketone reductase C1 [Crepidotus variabilis]|uniref:Conjugated polyketone reductase C1 n=1 Tax=Crepidotus variabilis TaxID=179855 RepID=A0A9P6E7E9_9AGAR|nr:conjugated polyketone reductase C1 [Crepidotus variabilis]
MTIQSSVTFKLLDDTTIPWIAWGNGTGDAKVKALDCGRAALESGIRHIDTAQIYHTEKETGESVKQSSLKREDIYVTSKLSSHDDGSSRSLDEVVPAIQESVDKLGSVPDLFLVHNPYVAKPGELKSLWKILEDLKDQGQLKSIGVSNFRPQDLEIILEGAKHKPVVNQLEYHPYTLAHLQPILDIQAKHGIVTESYGALTPLLRHPTGGPLKPVLERISARISKVHGKTIDPTVVLLLWTRAMGVVAVTASGNIERIKKMGEIATLPDLLTEEEIKEISEVGKKVHFRHYTEHMENDFALPDLPNGA